MRLNRKFVFKLIWVSTLLLSLISCTSKAQFKTHAKMGIVQHILSFSKSNASGFGAFNDTITMWFKDSLFIQQVRSPQIHTDEKNIKTYSSKPLMSVYIDLSNKVLYHYKNLSDTAQIFSKQVLPDSMMYYGWTFYSEKLRQIEGEPEAISDTAIDNVVYKRAKFHFVHNNPIDNFQIGYFRCDEKGLMFSLEKSYSQKLGCSMSKFIDYRYKNGIWNSYASIEVKYVADTLTKEQLAVFNAWEKNAKEHPVIAK